MKLWTVVTIHQDENRTAFSVVTAKGPEDAADKVAKRHDEQPVAVFEGRVRPALLVSPDSSAQVRP